MRVDRNVDRVFGLAKLGVLVMFLTYVALAIIGIVLILKASTYVQEECNGSVTYCMGKAFKESSDSFNRGLEGK